MKKTVKAVVVFLLISVLIPCISHADFIFTGHPDSDPFLVTLTLPYNYNKIRINESYVCGSLTLSAAAEYKWHTFSGTQDQIHSCYATRIEGKVKSSAILSDYSMKNKTTTLTFYGDDITLTQSETLYHTDSYTSNVTLINVKYYCSVYSTIDGSLIVSDYHLHSSS